MNSKMTEQEQTTDNQKVYEKLTPQQKAIVDIVMKNLVGGTDEWQKGWKTVGPPESAITGKRYRGSNRFYLSLAAMIKGYTDNRWITYKQMEDMGWRFKPDAEGISLGKNAGMTVEYFELRDKETKKPFSRLTLDGMTEEEKQEYMRKNVYPLRKFYRVFNGDIIDGIPALEKPVIDESGYSERAESFIKFWDQKECSIYYGGIHAFYDPTSDYIALPPKDRFFSLQEFYGTSLHEIGHSTGHSKRLNRKLGTGRKSPEYVEEELRAEIFSMFIMQELGLSNDTERVNNNSAYIKAWYDRIKENPNVLFTAIKDADDMLNYVLQKERQNTAEQEKSEVDNMDMDKMDKVDQEDLDSIPTTPSTVYIKPSEEAAKTGQKGEVGMGGRGVESLTRMSDREVVERAEKSKSGAKFRALFQGKSILGKEESDERSLMSLIAAFSKDKEQVLRVFKASGQYHDDKPNAYYEKLAQESMQFVEHVGSQRRAQNSSTEQRRKGHFGINAKS